MTTSTIMSKSKILKYFIIFLSLAITPIIISSGLNGRITGHYTGFWARTIWEYNFFENNTFWFKSTGHFGNRLSSGHYVIIQDTLILNSTPTDTIKEEMFYIFNQDKYIIDGDSCIIHLKTGYDYCKSKTQLDKDPCAIHTSRKRLKK